MKKIFFFCACVLVPALSIVSCKPQLHSNNPTPANYRILSYTKTTNSLISLPTPVLPRTLHENFRFYYTSDNKVDHIVYTTNDIVGGDGLNMVFNYKHDTIFKVYYNLRTNDTVRLDTFLQNSAGLITTAYTAIHYDSRLKTNYEYLGQLLTRQQSFSYRQDNINGRTRGTNITGPLTTYTSDNGDFLKHTYETSLTATFLSNEFDTIKNVYWVYLPTDTVKHGPLSYGTYKDILTNYTQKPILLIVRDNRDSTDTVGYVGSINNIGDLWYNESYAFYTTMADRPGDWMYIQSFTMFGANIYRNKHLVKQIYSVKGNMDIKYSIDAYSKITQVITEEKDEFLNTYSSTYDVQYEVFQ